MRNFAYPYFSRDIAEFWRRWHISLSTWFRDYLYIPLGGSQGGMWMKIRNTFIIFIVSGFWHGANWTFVIWGLLNAIYFLPLLITNNNRNNLHIVAEGKFLPTFKDFIKIIVTFTLTVLAWIFFRAENVNHAFSILTEIFSTSLFDSPKFFDLKIIALLFFFLFIEWIGKSYQHPLHILDTVKRSVFKYTFYLLILFVIYFYGKNNVTLDFIYFQF
jgi:D-alanyl-lipoteichoic acid acyltransferase DltB (MBOAT superfamily)